MFTQILQLRLLSRSSDELENPIEGKNKWHDLEVTCICLPWPGLPFLCHSAMDCHLQLDWSHSYFIFSESDSSEGVEEPRRKGKRKKQPADLHLGHWPAGGSTFSPGKNFVLSLSHQGESQGRKNLRTKDTWERKLAHASFPPWFIMFPEATRSQPHSSKT